jgi:hypothetical protein
MADLARKAAILERELAIQRYALDRLKQMACTPRKDSRDLLAPPVRKSA